MYQEEFSDLITIDELCELLSIGRNYAYSLLNSGEVKAFRIGRIWKIPRGAVWEYIKRKSGLQQPYFSFTKTVTPFLPPLPGTAALKSRKSLVGFAKLFLTNRNSRKSTALEKTSLWFGVPCQTVSHRYIAGGNNTRPVPPLPKPYFYYIYPDNMSSALPFFLLKIQ